MQKIGLIKIENSILPRVYTINTNQFCWSTLLLFFVKLNTFNEDPFYNPDRYTFIQEKLPEVGNKNVLNYPFQGKCEAPIKRVLSLDERREILYKKMGRPY